MDEKPRRAAGTRAWDSDEPWTRAGSAARLAGIMATTSRRFLPSGFAQALSGTDLTTTITSSDLPPWARKLLLALFVLGVIPVAIYGVYRQVVAGTKTAPAIEATLLVPYAEALATEDHARAYSSFTSAAFRERVSLEKYREAVQANREKHGAVQRFALHVCTETKEPGRPWFVECEALYVGAKQEWPVSFEIVEHDGRYLIDRSFSREGASETRVEHPF